MYSYSQKKDVFGTVITLPGRADLDQAVAGPCRLHLYAQVSSYLIRTLGCLRINRVESS